MKVEVIQAWPRRFESRWLELPEGTTVQQAVMASGLDLAGVAAYAVFGQRVDGGQALADGDRLELLHPLSADPKEARRKRAATGRQA